MPECDHCGMDVMLPFTCAYCGGSYCAEHRLPENHQCPHRPKVPPPYLKGYDIAESPMRPKIMKAPPTRLRLSPTKKLIAILAIVLIGIILVYYAYPYLVESNQSPSVPSNPSTTPSVPSTTPSNTPPTTSSYQDLVDYALSLINSDRQSKGLQNVTLSDIDSGQLHAENMLKNNFFSHWDMNGYKPYMRYTLAGGRGSVSENCAAQLGFYSNIKETLRDMEWRMMYDDADSDWGHRDNILDPLHNKVSIGIAFDNNDVYLVQDFEDDYISWSTLSLSNEVQMQGTVLKAGETISQVAIFFDDPTSLTTQQLSNVPYQGGYDAGTYVGMVVSPPPAGSQYLPPEEGILIIANIWSESEQNFSIRFDMSNAFAQHGKGVYTLYLWTASDEYLTSLSIWN